MLRYDGTTGAFIDSFASEGNPRSAQNLIFGPRGDLFVSSWGDERVLRFDGTTGAYIADFVPSGSGGLIKPWGLAFDSEDNLYVVGADSGQVLRYSPRSTATFTVTLSSPCETPITVDFTTADDTATAGSDYTAVSGTLVFESGVTSKKIIVPTIDNVFAEQDETFLVNLFNPTGGATVAVSQGVATIVDDNDLPLQGDFNSNGTVDKADLSFWEGGFGTTNGADPPMAMPIETVDVDGNDFLSWQRNLTPPPEPTGDFNTDGSVDGDDLDIWEGGFGTTTDANLDDGDSDEDGDVDGQRLLSVAAELYWQFDPRTKSRLQLR